MKCTLRADSHCGKAENNTTLYSNYPPIKNKLKNFKNKYNKNVYDLHTENGGTLLQENIEVLHR